MSKYASIMKQLDIPYLSVGSDHEFSSTEKEMRNRIDLLTFILRDLLDELDTDEESRNISASYRN